METRAPTRARLAVMVAFALSCFALLLYVWSSFGGPVPLQAKAYRFQVGFDEATQLSQQAEVRISGVPVGKVIRTSPGEKRTLADVELEARYAPLPADTRAILRQKTLLGETYVELTPGSPDAPKLPDGGRLPDAQVASTVELDEILRALDPRTRRDLQRLLGGLAAATRGRAPDVSDAVGNLAPTTEEAAGLLEVLHSQRGAVRRLVRDGGKVLRAVGRRDADVRGLITSGEQVLATTAARDRQLAETVALLPTFLRELRPTLRVAEATAAAADPVVRGLRPAARVLRPVLADASAVAPDARRLFRSLGPLITLSRPALPAATRLVRAAGPLVDVLHPVGRELSPVVDYLALYRQELVTMFANLAGATQATFRNPGAAEPLHYLRVLIPVWTEAFVTQPRRLPSNRHNPYFLPRALDKLAGGLEAFDCANLSNPQTVPALGPSPPCRVQGPLEFRGESRKFPHLKRDPP